MLMKKILPIFLFTFIFVSHFLNWVPQTFADNRVNIYFFWGNGCPHCAAEEPFLEKLQQKYPEVRVYSFEVWYNAKNRDLLMQAGKILNKQIGGVPFTVIGTNAVVGYLNDETTGTQIESYVLQCLKNGCDDPLASLISGISITPIFTPQPTPTPTPPPTILPTPISTEEIKAYFFWSSGCPLCNAEKQYLEKLKILYPNLKIESLELSKKENLEIFKKALDELQVDNAAVPFLVIGKKYVLGWKNEETTGVLIEDAIQCYLETGCPDVVGSFIASVQVQTDSAIPEKLKLPLFGEIKTKNISLPVLSVILGGLDGFNPCAMWVLIFLISFLLGMKDRKRMWLLGFTFLFVSGLVYFLFMAAWLKLLLFIGAIFWVRLIIALVAVAAGTFSLKEYSKERKKKDQGITCDVTTTQQKKKIIERMKEVVHKRSLVLAFIGIIALAFSVNLVELVCSAGFPVVFTQLLAMSSLAKWQYFLYMLIYIVMYILDDFIVFIIAMLTLKVAAKSNKYTLYARFIGGVLMIVIGLLLVFKPSWLMFG